MKDSLTGRIIAERVLHLATHGRVIVSVEEPFAVSDANEEFWCQYQIIGLGNEQIKRGIGIDALQALILALHKISNDLYFSNEFKMGVLSWEGGMTASDLGLPVSENILEDVKRLRSCVDILQNSNDF